MNSLKIVHWNCRSIRNKHTELFNFLISQSIDICLLSETWLKSNDELKHPKYMCVRNDRLNGVGGGVALLIKNQSGLKKSQQLIPPLLKILGLK